MRMKQLVLGAAAAACVLGGARASHAEDSVVDPELDAPVPETPHFAVRASAGGSARALFGAYIAGGETDIGVGVDTSVGSYGLAATVFAGVLEGGFTIVHVAAGFDLMWPVGIVRLGMQPRVGYLGMERLTSDRQFGAYTFGLAARATVDLHRDDGVAVALGIEPTVDVVAALGNDGASADSATGLYGGSAFLEIRWRRPERPASGR